VAGKALKRPFWVIDGQSMGEANDELATDDARREERPFRQLIAGS
jgi:hypothetical protein